MKDLFDTYEFKDLYSHASFRTDLFKRDIATTPLTDFFGGVQNVEISAGGYLLEDGKEVAEEVKMRGETQNEKIGMRQPRLLNQDSRPTFWLFGFGSLCLYGLIYFF